MSTHNYTGPMAADGKSGGPAGRKLIRALFCSLVSPNRHGAGKVIDRERRINTGDCTEFIGSRY